MLNKQKGHMYDWVTHTWNPIKGYCDHACTYCYMHRFGFGNLRLDNQEFETNLKSDNFIFVGSGTDVFSNSVPKDWIEQVLKYCSSFDNRYLFQSKNPERFHEFLGQYPANTTFCTTIESNRDYPGVNQAPKINDRAIALLELKKMGYGTSITIEPILDFDFDIFINGLRQCSPKWISIGADTRASGLPAPSKEKTQKLIESLQSFTRVIPKKTLNRLKTRR